MDGLTQEQEIICHGISHSSAAAASGIGAGLAQIPLSDTALITPIQIAMIISLGQVIGVRADESIAKGIITGAGAAFIGRGAVQFLVGWIPMIGNGINATTAGAITESIGWIAVNHFISILKTDEIKFKKQGYYEAEKEYYEKYQKQAKEFLKQKKILKEEIGKYQILLLFIKEYKKKLKIENKIDELEELETLFNQLKTLKIDKGE